MNIMNQFPSLFNLNFWRFIASFPLDVLFEVLLVMAYIQWQIQHFVLFR